MANLTVRNIPERALERIRERAVAERRSLNNEIVVLLEQAVASPLPAVEGSIRAMPLTEQFQRWTVLCGRWHDERSWQEIAADIASQRTTGREVTL